MKWAELMKRATWKNISATGTLRPCPILIRYKEFMEVPSSSVRWQMGVLFYKKRALVALSFIRPESILRKQLLNFDRQTILHCLLDDFASYDGPDGKSTSSGQTYAISEDGGKKWKFFPLWVIAEGNESKYLPYFDKSLMKRKPRY